MRKGLMAAAALAAMAGAAQAQNATQQIKLDANVGGYCTIDGVASALQRSATVLTENGKVKTPGALALGGQTGKVICTSNAQITLMTEKGGMTGPTPTDTLNYTNKIHYTATASLAGATGTATQSLSTDGKSAGYTTGASTATTGGLTNADLVLSVNIAQVPDGKYLVYGAYTDTITVTLIPTT